MHTVTTNIEKLLKQLAGMLPQVTVYTKEIHLVKGAEILSWGTITQIDGVPINPDKTYRWHYPVITAANHFRRMKERYKKNGIEGIENYLQWLNKLAKGDKMTKAMQALALLIKTIEENK